MLRGLRVVGTHGVLPEERQRSQPFEVDLVLHVDLAAAGASDDLAETVDYGAVADAVDAVVRGRQFGLLEALASTIADTVLALDVRVAAVDVAVTKLRPPVPVDLATAGVRMRRTRP